MSATLDQVFERKAAAQQLLADLKALYEQVGNRQQEAIKAELLAQANEQA
jgi:hypothetical protein